jgi:hypothetical protein
LPAFASFGWWDGLLEDELVQRNLLAGPDRSSTLQIAPEIRISTGYAVPPMAEMLIIIHPFHKLLNSEDEQNQRQKLQESAPGHRNNNYRKTPLMSLYSQTRKSTDPMICVKLASGSKGSREEYGAQTHT